jgi:hypothetical protein
MPKVYEFYSTGNAYDASQCRDDIEDGDILLVPNEGAAAILVRAWPIAVSQETAGEAFHTLEDGAEWETYDDGKYLPSLALLTFALSEWERVTRK